jgi:hypothetical protein
MIWFFLEIDKTTYGVEALCSSVCVVLESFYSLTHAKWHVANLVPFTRFLVIAVDTPPSGV